MSQLTIEELYNLDRGERAVYVAAAASENAFEAIPLPLTRDGFAALAEALATKYGLPDGDGLRTSLVAYIHHLDAKDTTSIAQMGQYLLNKFSQGLTWVIDQEMKSKRQAQLSMQTQLAKKAAAEAKRNARAAKRKGLKVVGPDAAEATDPTSVS
jgi:hypothetical protein